MGMVRLSIDGNVVTFEGPGVAPIADADDFDPRQVLVGWLSSIDGGELERLVGQRAGYDRSATAVTLEVLLELARGG